MTPSVNVLLVEDNEADAVLVLRALRQAGIVPAWRRVDTEADFLAALDEPPDLILSDYQMPQFTGPRALRLLQGRGLEIPFIIVSGTIGEETAVEAMRQGATDYLLKDRLARLGPAVRHALEAGQLRAEQRQAESALRLFRTLMDQSADAFEIIEPETGRFLDVSAKSCAVLGYTREEHLKLCVADIDPTIKAAGWSRMAAVIRAGDGWNGEGIHQRKDGTVFPVELAAKWVRLERDYIVTVARDITERKRTEEMLRVSRQEAEAALRRGELEQRQLAERLLAAQAVGKVGSWETDLTTLTVIWSEQTHHIFETDPRTFQVSHEAFLQLVHPDDRAAVDRALQASLPVDQAGMIEHRIQLRSGRTGMVEERWRVFRDDAGRAVRAVGTCQDITERKLAEAALRESEERFRQVVESIQEVFWMTDTAKHQVLYISPGYEKIWGRSRESLYASSLSWLESIHPEDSERVLAAARTKQVLGTYDEEYRIVRPDGTIRWVRDRAFPVHDATGTVYRITGVAKDITERKELEQQFLRAQRLEAIGTLASGVAHDLNNILAPVLMAAGLLRNYAKGETESRMLTLIEQSAQRGAGIISQLLAFSRGVEGERLAIRPAHLIKEMVEFMQETFPRRIEIEPEVPDDLWRIVADATQVHQILLNLCVNARDAMPEGGRLRLTALNRMIDEKTALRHDSAKPGPYLVVTVADTGQGIPAEVMPRIFDPFFTTKGIGKGTGLGLSTVIGIVKSHEGFVTVESQLGQGTEFRIFLPALTDPAEPAPPLVADPPVHGRGEQILVVDDEAAIREALGGLLEAHHYRVLKAGSGEEAMQLLIKYRGSIRLLLTDMMMPGMDGLALIRALHLVEPAIKVIAVSGLDQEDRRAEMGALGVKDILPKPFTPAVLLHTIASLL